MRTIAFRLHPLPPFRLDLTVWALRRRPENRIDLWDGVRYVRILTFGGVPVKVVVSQECSASRPVLHVSISGRWRVSDLAMRLSVKSTLERLLGLRRDLRTFSTLARNDRHLKALGTRFRGVKPPRFPTIFESLVNAFACQQLTLTVGILLLNRLACSYGLAFAEREETFHAFPRPEDLCGAGIAELRGLGFSSSKSRAIIELAGGIVDRHLDLDKLEEMDNNSAVGYLKNLRGVGRWSAEYVMLRGLGRMFSFPGDDIGGQKNVQMLLRLRKRPDYDRMKQIATRWHPYAGFVYIHLLLRNLEEQGHL